MNVYNEGLLPKRKFKQDKLKHICNKDIRDIEISEKKCIRLFHNEQKSLVEKIRLWNEELYLNDIARLVLEPHHRVDLITICATQNNSAKTYMPTTTFDYKVSATIHKARSLLRCKPFYNKATSKMSSNNRTSVKNTARATHDTEHPQQNSFQLPRMNSINEFKLNIQDSESKERECQECKTTGIKVNKGEFSILEDLLARTIFFPATQLEADGARIAAAAKIPWVDKQLLLSSRISSQNSLRVASLMRSIRSEKCGTRDWLRRQSEPALSSQLGVPKHSERRRASLNENLTQRRGSLAIRQPTLSRPRGNSLI